MMSKKGKDKPKDQDVKIEVKSAEQLQAELAELRSRAETLSAQAQTLSKEKDEIFAQLQRVSADYANYQKRIPKQVADTVAWEKEQIIRSILPVLDNFEHTLGQADKAENVAAVLKGIAIIYDQMLGVLRGHGVEQSAAKGEPFDPARHEAMMRRSDADQPDGMVLEEFQKGYLLHGRVIRPSKVIVNKLESPVAPSEPGSAEPAQGAGASPGPSDAKTQQPQEPADGGNQANKSDSEQHHADV
ncbi:MAG TPA: nucleotide exchange factor GrpE [Phycisphaerales bacterium]|nr:nucleotide exchange factor GrpE [Phycisphaerales bacterium]